MTQVNVEVPRQAQHQKPLTVDSTINTPAVIKENLVVKTIGHQKTTAKLRKVAQPEQPTLAHRAANETQKEAVKAAENIANDYDVKLEETTVTPKVAPEKNKSTMTLTFTAEETNKYLDKNALAEATQEDKKSSTFKKLLKKANDLKSNQDPFGDLREMKNEILALNFKNEKRGQNK